MYKADLVLKNAKVYTMSLRDDHIVEAVAVKNDRIIFTGSNDDIKEYIDISTNVLDLKGKVVLPGFIDSHVHVPGNAYILLYNINLFDALTEKETISIIRSFIADHPDLNNYYGRGFMSGVFGGLESSIGPRKERLDEICPDKPVVIIDNGGHIFWLNSKAFEFFGITKDTPDVPGGIIEKDKETGELWGTLKDEAKCLIKDQDFTLDEQIKAMKLFQNTFNCYGYTSVFALRPSATSNPNPILEAINEIEKKECLTIRIYGAREIKTIFPEMPQINELANLKHTYNTNKVKVTTAKFFVDGVVEGVSAWLSEPYLEAAGKGPNYYGQSLWEQSRLINAFTETLKAGLNIHVHAIGDMAVTKTIDALKMAQNTVPGDHRNTITHLQIVNPKDIRRMKELSIIACVNAFWHFRDPCEFFELELPFLGRKRAEAEYPLASFVDNDVLITCASDFPITPYPSPFYAIQTGVTRNIFTPDYFQVDKIIDIDDPKWLLNKNERVTVEDMVKAYTINGAYALYAEDEIGSIEVGKYADMIIIDQDIFNVHPLEIEKTQVLKTIFDGCIVYEK